MDNIAELIEELRQCAIEIDDDCPRTPRDIEQGDHREIELMRKAADALEQRLGVSAPSQPQHASQTTPAS
jgi:hypothetical protein